MNRNQSAIKNAEAAATILYTSATKPNISTQAVYRRDTESVESCPYVECTRLSAFLQSLIPAKSDDREDKIMMKTITAAVLAGTFALTAAADANAWSRDRSVSGANGTASMHASGGCSGGSCSRDVTRSGPDGQTYSRSRTVTCQEGGSCSGSAATTGPNGNTVIRQGSVNW